MALKKTEVSRFGKGLISSASEEDLTEDAATFSLNVDAEREVFALRGIKGNYILDKEGWSIPRYARWEIDVDNISLHGEVFVLHSYDKVFAFVFTTNADGSLSYQGTDADIIDDNDWTVVTVNISSSTSVGEVADAIKLAIDSNCTCSSQLTTFTGETTYFTVYRGGTGGNNNGSVIIKSNFLGDIPMPYTPTELTGTIASGDMKFPDPQIYGSNATRYVKGTGLTPTNNTETGAYDFSFLKSFNIKGSSNIFGISKDAKAHLFQNLGDKEGASSSVFSEIAITGNPNEFSAEQRNTNLYIGTGGGIENQGLWLGEVDRKQLNKTFDKEMVLEVNKLDTLSRTLGSIKYSNVVVPTLHYGLNSTNGGIAGAANIYAYSADNADVTDNTYGAAYIRTVHEWAVQCLKNVDNTSTLFDNYDDFKLGMIFRLDLYGPYVAGSAPSGLDATPHAGTSAYEYLREVKQFAKGDFSNSKREKDGNHDGGDGEELHSGDLFQIVYVPDAASVSNTVTENTADMIRFAYVGTLTGDSNTDSTINKHDSTGAYFGLPSYAFAHFNDDKYLHRLRITGKSENHLKNSTNTVRDSRGTEISFDKKMTDSIDLEQELGISNFKIGTMAECKSADGAGNFGGGLPDGSGGTQNKNYFTGYGKLWVSNKEEHNVLYLIDVSNWDKTNNAENRISYTKVDLNFNRIHKHLFNLDDSDYGKGLLRLWYDGDEGADYGKTDKDTLIGEYNWSPEPENQYISSICETYSHKPHLGDEAGGGAANGDGKWRVWVSYTKNSDIPHARWDLFLFNFRPEPWGSAANDSQLGLGSSGNTTVYMFDKTPPYQECAYYDIHTEGANVEHRRIYYPFDKFAISRGEASNSAKASQIIDNGTSSLGLSAKDKGAHYVGWRPGGWRRTPFSTIGVHSNNLNFHNPSGEYHSWHQMHGADFHKWDINTANASPIYYFFMGRNIGWLNGEARRWKESRHTLKPYYRQWYFTGNGTSSANREPREELGAPVAHIVSLFGKLEGHFIKDGGTVRCLTGNDPSDNPNIRDAGWYGYQDGEIEKYENDLTMITMHDSPVAFSVLSGGTENEETAVFSSGETQGTPVDNTSPTTYTDPYGTSSQNVFQDVEAGFFVDKSVPATLGYSRYNQFRYHHDYNGIKDLNLDTGHTNAAVTRAGYGKDKDSTTGGAYFGNDGFGHYNMITITWACNQDILNNTDTKQTILTTNNRGRWRVFGNHGLDKSRVVFRKTNTTFHGLDDSGHNGMDSDNVINIKNGTGYCTYGWPNNDNDNDIDEDAGFYSSTDNVSFGSDAHPGTPNYGTEYQNRKTVHCWSTTALTDSVFHNTDYTDTNDGDWEVYKSPRCSFRKIVPPSGWKFENIKNVDLISWQKPSTSDEGEINTGYLIQGLLENSPYSDINDSATGMMVINPKVYDKGVKEKIGEEGDNEKEGYIACQTTAAIAPVGPLLKQRRINRFDEWTSAIAGYKNDFLMSKNLVPGLADMGSSAGYSRTWRHDDGTSHNTFNRFFDIYSPIMIGTQGDNTREILSIWARPQFDIGKAAVKEMYDSSNFPYYICDRLFNFWASDNRACDEDDGGTQNSSNSFDIFGFDRSIKIGETQDTGPIGQTTNTDLQPTEGWGSSVGSSKVATQKDDIYPSSYTSDDEYIEDGNITDGAHIKILKNTFLVKDSEEEVSEGTGEFGANTSVFYKISFLYDGFQESPLNDTPFEIDVTNESKFLRLHLQMPTVEEAELSPRVTHINLYRKNESNELYRLVKSVNLNGEDDPFELIDGQYVFKIKDEFLMATYEAINGVAESLTDLTPNYTLSCQLNDFLFVSGIGHPDISQEGKHMIMRSKQSKFSVFDWSNDFIDLPTEPIALVAFAGRIFAFDENNTYKIHPQGLYIEDVSEGVGILNSQSIVTTDVGMFFADRNNIYVHNGKNASPIGGPILYSQTKPEWQIGYLDAIVKADKLGYSPKLTFHPSKQLVYVVLQGYGESFLSFRQHKSRAYAFNIEQKRWDYLEIPTAKAITTTSKGDVVIGDGYQVYNYNIDKRNRKSFDWESVAFNMGSTNYDKSFKSLKISGDLCLLKFNNNGLRTQTSTGDGDENADDMGGNVQEEEQGDWKIADNSHILDVTEASENDDLKVYVDNVLQTMRLQNKKPNIGHYIANDTSGTIYQIQTPLPAFNNANNGLTGYNGEILKDSFSLNINSLPEFLTWPTSQFRETTKQGGVEELIYIHKGMYLYFSGKRENGEEIEEIVKVRDIMFFWLQDDEGINELDTSNSNAVTIRTWRGQLGTKALDWNAEPASTTINNIRVVCPTFKYPQGAKGRDTKIVFKNQKASIDSFAITYRPRRFK